MGNNCDLVRMLGVPEKVACPKCREQIDTDFEDYDIECGRPNEENGKWSLDVYCHDCDHSFNLKYKISLIKPDSFTITHEDIK